MKLLWQASLLSGLVFSAAASAQVDPSVGGTVSQQAFGSRYALNSANPANLLVVADPAGSGRSVLKTTVKDAQSAVDGIKRTDFYPLNEASASGLRWYAISVYIPSDWTVHPYPAVVAQMDTSTSATNLAAPLSLLVRGSTLELNLNSNYRGTSGADVATAANSAAEVLKLGPLVTSKWYCLVIRSDWSPSLGRGAITMWMNGEKVYNANNSTNSYFGAAHVPRAGLMFPGLMGVTERSVYTDFIRMGGVNTTVLNMYAVTPCAAFVTGPTIQW
ncbi:MAG: polysaccharide lyase [Pseudomonadota bacterium]